MRIIYTIIALGFFGFLNAQNEYQRTFPLDNRSESHIASSVTGDDGYFMMNFYEESTTGRGINLRKHGPKGAVLWSFDYEFTDEDEIGQVNEAGYYYGDVLAITGGAVFVVSAFDDGSLKSNIIVSVSNDGQEIWSYSYAPDNQTFGDHVKLIPNGDGGFVLLSKSGSDVGPAQVSVSNLNPDGSFVFNGYAFNVEEDNVSKTIGFADAEQVAAAEGVIMCGEVFPNGFYLNRSSILGVPEWASKYSIADSIGSHSILPVDMADGPDTSFVVVGEIVPSMGTRIPFITSIDKNGDIQWSKSISPTAMGVNIIVPTAVEYLADSSIWVMSKFTEVSSAGALNGELGIKLDLQGNVVSKKRYERLNTVLIDPNNNTVVSIESSIGSTSDGGFAYTSTGFNGTDNNSYVVKGAADGSARCDVDFLDTIVVDMPMIKDTLGIESSFLMERDTAELTKAFFPFERYDFPIPNLLDTTFCPNDPIDVLLDASHPTAVAYLWDDMSTDATRRVMEEGSFKVTITFDDKVCWQMCDTASIVLFGEPTVSIAKSPEFLCDSSGIFLTADAQEAAPFEYIWSTMDTDPTILATEAGNYSVTVTDICGATAVSSAQITDAELVFPFDYTIDQDPISCESGFGIIRVYLNNQDPNNDASSVNWSNGDIDTLIVTEPGTYTATIIDVCGQTWEETISLTDSDFDTEIVVDIIAGADPIDCIGGMSFITLGLDSINGGEIFSTMWSTGDTTETLTISEAGIYGVTVTDVCGKEISDEIEIIPGQLETIYSNDPSFSTWYSCLDTSILISPRGINNIFEWNWSTGLMGTNNDPVPSITVFTPGTYSLTVTDICGETTFGDITIDEDDFQIKFELDTLKICQGLDKGFSIFEVGINTDVASYDWSTDESGPILDSIFVLDPGNYKLTVTDLCDDTAERELSLSEDEVACPPCLEFPNVILTNAPQDSLLRFFGPVNHCGEENISDYILEIYNRWGKKVFESTSLSGPDSEWDGNVDNVVGKDAPTDVYMFVSSWINDVGREETAKGDITLIKG